MYSLRPFNNQNFLIENLFHKQLPCVEARNYRENYKEIVNTYQTPAFKKLLVIVNVLVKGGGVENRTDIKITSMIEFHWFLLPTLPVEATA